MSSLHCTICNALDSKLCAGCGSSAYCSVECQRTDWSLHKLLCSSYKSFMETRPSPDHKLVILFPTDSETPQLQWAECETDILEDYFDGSDVLVKKAFHKFNYEELLGGKCIPGYNREIINEFRKFRLPTSITICSREGFLVDRSAINKCIVSVTKGITRTRFGWAGPIFVARRPFWDGESDGDYDLYLDATLDDLRYGVDYFRTYGSTDGNTNQLYRGKKILGVRVNCVGEQGERGVFESVAVPGDHPLGLPTELTKLLGLPLRVYKYPHPKSWEGSRVNQPITKLHCNVDPSSPSWGVAPDKWQSGVGSVLLVRGDGKDLDMLTAEALCAFVHSQNLFQDSWEAEESEDGGVAERAKVMEVISKAGFQKFFGEYRKKQLDDGKNEWKDIASPFDVKDAKANADSENDEIWSVRRYARHVQRVSGGIIPFC